MSLPVLVVGAGPVGLTLVALLARLGVPTVLLERGERLEDRSGSRAICIQRDILEILERAGCGRVVAEAGRHVRRARTYFGSREIFRGELPPDPTSPFPPYVSYPQAALEALLLERLEAHPLVDLRFSHRVTAIHQDDEGVRVVAATASGAVTLRGAYLVGCDGGRSTVRRALDVKFDGYQHAERFLIADVRGALPYAPGERHFFFSPPFNPGRQVLLFPQPDDVWRIDWQVPEHLGDPETERRSGRLAARIARIAGHEDCELVWLSAYQFQQRVAERFRVGRAFLAGDAAHLMAPFGARGMTSGIADAENLAWKLALVLAGAAPEALLDTYDPERRAAARHNVATVEASLRFMVPPNRRERLRRDALLYASRFSSRARRRVDAGKLYEPFPYPGGGVLAPDARCALPDGSPTRLREQLGASLLALYLAPEADAARRFARRVDPGALPVDLYVGLDRDAPVPDLPSAVVGLRDTHGELSARFDRGGMVVIRPDGHVAGRRAGGPEACAEALPELVAAALHL